ncbi:hypothetical protein NQ317_010501 [Molorchus minor]|uniref:Cytochrome P450 n=1 Tax=Molorchus minor TaxID=1323400 RepID=A0ABQ9ITD2_9CUCU|nr:hypothetical protein NQ317_010501 [Molorchus minor]
MVSWSWGWDLLVLVTTLVAAIYAYIWWSYQYWRRRGLPYLEPKAPFGTFPNPFDSTAGLRGSVRKMYNEAKSRGWRHVGLYRLTKPIYMPMDLDLIKSIMTKDFSHFVDRGLYYNEKDDPISAHLFALGGTKWRNLRVKLTPTFTSGKLKAMFQTVVDCGLVMEEYIQKNINDKDPVEIKELLGRLTTNVIGTCAFGIDCNTFKDEDSPFTNTTRKLFKTSILRSLRAIFSQSFPGLCKSLGIRSVPRDISDFYTKVVEDTVNYRLKNNITRKDLLQLLIDIKTDKDGNKDGYQADGKSLTMNEIVAESFLFFLAGFETSSTTMTFALYLLAVHPELQEKVREEIRTVFARHGNQMTYDSLNELKYMKQVIDETLRMYSPLPFVTRECVESYKIPDEDTTIEVGTGVMIPIEALHYDPEYFENPTTFDPDRFSEENKKNIPQYAYLPFGEGPRICIGERFGVMQTKVGLACLLRNYRVTLNEKNQTTCGAGQEGVAACGRWWYVVESAKTLVKHLTDNMVSWSWGWDLLILVTTLVAAIYAYIWWSYQYWRRRGLPYLEPKAPFGTFPSPFDSTGLRESVRKNYNEAKSRGWRYVGLYRLTKPDFMPMDLDLIKSIMTKDFSHFVDRGVYYNEKDDPINVHLFTLGGAKWRNLRVKLTPTFTSGKLKAMFQTVVDCGLVMEEYIQENINNKDPVEIKELLGRLTTNVIGTCAFGIDCNTFKDEDSPFTNTTRRLFKPSILLILLGIFAESFPGLSRSLGIRSVPRDISDFYTKVVEDTVNYRLKNNITRKDLLQLLIDIKTDKDGNKDGYQGERFGVMQTKVGLACLLRNYRVTLNEKTKQPLELDKRAFLPVVAGGPKYVLTLRYTLCLPHSPILGSINIWEKCQLQ